MNLVDAIRKASLQAQQPVATINAHLSEDEVTDEEIDEALGVEQPQQLVVADRATDDGGTKAVPQPSQAPAGHATEDQTFPAGPGLNLVRFEVFLTPEQMSAMLRGALSSHRSVMTVREAAQYLRIPSSTVERLAMDGNLPGFMIEGTWRFLRTTIDDWVTARAAFPEEGLHDVA